MSTLLSAQSVSYHTTSAPLLEEISFTLTKGDRIGLVGHNGCGKSTLLRLLSGNIQPLSGLITTSSHCLMAHVEQHLPANIESLSMLDAVVEKLPANERQQESWRAELLLADMGFCDSDWQLTSGSLSGGQHTRLLLARALIQQPDLLLLDEPSNHLDLPTLLWLEQFLLGWKGSFVLVSHDKRLLDKVTNCTWILRDNTLGFFRLPCSEALQALEANDEAAQLRHQAEQKEIDRIEKSAKRLAVWGQVYDNEDLSRKAKHMEKRLDRLKGAQTDLTAGTPWQLTLSGEALPADRLLNISDMQIRPSESAPVLFHLLAQQIKSGDKLALIGRNGCGKSSLLKMLWQAYKAPDLSNENIQFHPRCRLGFYDQTLKQLHDEDNLIDALRSFTNLPQERRKMALISAGFAYSRHSQQVKSLSGGERSRLLMLGLSLANYHLLLLDEPTNHLDLQGKAELAATLEKFEGGFMLVTHDRELIETSCNRYWLIEDGKLSQWHDIEKLYAALDATQPVSGNGHPAKAPDTIATPESTPEPSTQDTQLERLFELEALLEADLNRKEKYQKPRLQQQWREQIAQLNVELGFE
ncbi:ABC-F family ATP-binding cassette domain-containing protein [Photobacterium sp. BZF1]|uniref:ABC-F family ATP-binding cassette domain-containing protein n=1 Tax=Photobacterium sp. BZF1 TaxID=1904457 RepID=UPI0016534F5B|nr:ABC-F family ATP-binding cassette domain-containing protein [Photobacterium sp. BZF1]MBC7005121.1 ABC-F family ATP-binding cassette domain-containing protein [Photobacterium sp. BZF1]